jgi:hypothetical protein
VVLIAIVPAIGGTVLTGSWGRYTILDECTLREVTTRNVAPGGRQLDVVMIGPYEAPQFGSDTAKRPGPENFQEIASRVTGRR